MGWRFDTGRIWDVCPRETTGRSAGCVADLQVQAKGALVPPQLADCVGELPCQIHSTRHQELGRLHVSPEGPHVWLGLATQCLPLSICLATHSVPIQTFKSGRLFHGPFANSLTKDPYSGLVPKRILPFQRARTTRAS
jgi:hypothetical protein